MNKTEVKQALTVAQAALNEITRLNQEAAKLKVEVDSIYDQLTAAGVAAGQYGNYLLDVKVKPVPRCTNWPDLHAYIKETGAFELLHKRLTETACLERKTDGEYLPGVVWDDKTSYKIKAK